MQLINSILLLAISTVYALPVGGARGQPRPATCKDGDIHNPTCFTRAQAITITNNNSPGRKAAAVADRLAGVAIPKGGVPNGATVLPLTPGAQQAQDLGLSRAPDGTLRKITYTGRRS